MNIDIKKVTLGEVDIVSKIISDALENDFPYKKESIVACKNCMGKNILQNF